MAVVAPTKPLRDIRAPLETSVGFLVGSIFMVSSALSSPSRSRCFHCSNFADGASHFKHDKLGPRHSRWLDELRSLDVVLPTREVGEVRLRVVARPEKALAQLLAHLGLDLPQKPKLVENVVPKTAPSRTQPRTNQAALPHD